MSTGGSPDQTSVTGWASATTLTNRLTQLRHRATHAREAANNEADTKQPPGSPRTPTDSGGHVNSAVAQAPHDSTAANTFAKKLQDMFSTFPYFTPSTGSGPSLPTPSAPPQIEVDDASSPYLPTANAEDGPPGHGWQSVWSALDRLRSPYGKKPELADAPEASQDGFLDCIDDNNSIMMYGPLEPNDTSQVEIACSEIVSINGDGEEIRTPQPCYTPLPSESFEEVVVGSPPLSPLSPFLQLPLGSIDQVLAGSGPRSPQLRSPPLPSISRGLSAGGRSPRSPRVRSPLPLESINRLLRGGRSPQSHVAPLPMGSIDQVLAGGSEELNNPWNESGSSSVPETTDAAQSSAADGAIGDKPPVKEYRVWLPSQTKISVQTMWWGFRIYLPPPVLDVLNNKQLEAVKRAALITTALQWLMEHLPVALLPLQVRPGVTVLRHLVPYVGYMGGFIAWSWSAIRSFDKGYGVVLTASWLLPFLLFPGTWEAEEVPTQNTDTQPSPSISSP